MDGLADTSVFIARESRRSLSISTLPESLVVSVITIGELRAGVLTADDPRERDHRLSTLTWALRLEPVPVDDAVAQSWARLRVALRDRGRRMPVNDSWIAATAMALDVPVVTQDDDYEVDVPGLRIIRV
jgi:predicted nucleic acid-binding protein